MNANLAIRYGALNKILESLGMSAGDTEQCAATDGYRIDFEKNFTVELQHLGGTDCRVSARIFSLGKSLQVQENQIKLALNLFGELKNDMPDGVSTAISNHDNCLRLCVEIVSENNDIIMTQFQGFVHVAFAYKQTYFQHKGAT
ncbi:hypothetical protein LMED105_13112 [Limnobacter sp. MED105]|jgi:hypothetical protein|uniref:hypothetical protein n=2 Tax=Limnobacter TaxID=131079 RepID=UPI000156C73F|nr:hypothetical protein [Limnobacter sp.]EDM83712.1 hypothetical protein LMED105_13112 [Limnobacter sp. MED105]